MIKILFIAVVGLITTLSCNPLASAGEAGPGIKNKRITLQMANRPLYEIMGRLTVEYDIPIGFEEAPEDSLHGDYRFSTDVPYVNTWDGSGRILPDGPTPKVAGHLLTMQFEHATLDSVLNEIVRQMGNYSWEINDEVVNIHPLKGRNEKFRELLNVRVDEFDMSSGIKIIDLPRAIFRLPEIRQFLADQGLGSDVVQYSPYINRSLPGGRTFTGHTVRELLNAITKLKRGAWILRAGRDGIDANIVNILL